MATSLLTALERLDTGDQVVSGGVDDAQTSLPMPEVVGGDQGVDRPPPRAGLNPVAADDFWYLWRRMVTQPGVVDPAGYHLITSVQSLGR